MKAEGIVSPADRRGMGPKWVSASSWASSSGSEVVLGNGSMGRFHLGLLCGLSHRISKQDCVLAQSHPVPCEAPSNISFSLLEKSTLCLQVQNNYQQGFY